MARVLVRSILQPRLVYQAQFQRLTLRDWDLLETANRDVMRAITCLPRITPIATLQEEAQLNTIDEIVHQRRMARYLKSQAVPAAAALAHYYNSTLPQPAAPLPEIPPWLKAQASDNRPLTRLRQSNRQVEQEAAVRELRKVYSCACPMPLAIQRKFNTRCLYFVSPGRKKAAASLCGDKEEREDTPLILMRQEAATPSFRRRRTSDHRGVRLRLVGRLRSNQRQLPTRIAVDLPGLQPPFDRMGGRLEQRHEGLITTHMLAACFPRRDIVARTMRVFGLCVRVLGAVPARSGV
ncbi:hypothetical protein HPB52_010621 [Rhipicephalus sanguineus]|uniref:Uncharacterized protein n=1 Tax=Rhipicephalus sanguineus TaxID=34632 RepID=A0A9D4YN86_RHISA|nr:hypothetical protein HPB52_010621 [Rhipicephalus sanguineus]